MTRLIAETNAACFGRFRNKKCEMQAQDTFVKTSVGRKMLSRCENGKKRGFHPRNSLEQRLRLRTSAAISDRRPPERIEKICLPAIVARLPPRHPRQILEIRKMFRVWK